MDFTFSNIDGNISGFDTHWKSFTRLESIWAQSMMLFAFNVLSNSSSKYAQSSQLTSHKLEKSTVQWQFFWLCSIYFIMSLENWVAFFN